jgi:hypothetical protein
MQNTTILCTESNTNTSDTTFEEFTETANKTIAKTYLFHNIQYRVGHDCVQDEA